MTARQLDLPRIEALSIKNYRVLKQIELKGLTPLTVFLGPSGSGKSTIFDVFAFLSECFGLGLRKAWVRGPGLCGRARAAHCTR